MSILEKKVSYVLGLYGKMASDTSMQINRRRRTRLEIVYDGCEAAQEQGGGIMIYVEDLNETVMLEAPRSFRSIHISCTIM